LLAFAILFAVAYNYTLNIFVRDNGAPVWWLAQDFEFFVPPRLRRGHFLSVSLWTVERLAHTDSGEVAFLVSSIGERDAGLTSCHELFQASDCKGEN
jgi:hypothetical protein